MDTPEKRIAFLNSQVACALIEAQGMTAQNEEAKLNGSTQIPYLKYDFEQLIIKYGIGHNDVIGHLND